MRKDRFRVNGPESSFINLTNLTETTDKRRDGRASDQLRSIFGAVGVIAKANGSALMEADKIKVVCGVHIKPASATRSDSKCFFDFKFAPFSTLVRSGFIKVFFNFKCKRIAKRRNFQGC
jgi:exosome complex RNA-binding protein Rrp42 (RNase PH superfamily)